MVRLCCGVVWKPRHNRVKPAQERTCYNQELMAGIRLGRHASRVREQNLMRKEKKRIYVETTVVSYLVARPSMDVMVAGHQAVTHTLWPELLAKYDAYVSALVYEEARKGDPEQAVRRLDAIKPFRLLDIGAEAHTMAAGIIANRGIPKEYPEDALHIAVAAVNEIDVLVTWNFAHLNNPFTRMKVRQAVERQGCVCPEICSPEELLETDK